MPNMLRYGLKPVGRLLKDLIEDPFARAILSIQAGDHGMAPARAPTALHAGLQSYYFDGACYPKGGAHSIPEALTKQIERHGGRIFFESEVDRVLVRSGRAIGVRLVDGQEVRADIVVSNTDPGVTWGRFVDPEHQGFRLRRRIARMRYSLSTVSLFLAVDMDLRAAGFDSGNVWYSRTTDVDAAYRAAESHDVAMIESVPGMFFNVTTLKDPSLRSDGLHTVEALALGGARSFEAWKGLPMGRRGPDYAAQKDRLARLILAEVERFAPGFSERVVFQSLGTPLTNMHFLQTTGGAMYGTEKTIRNLGPFSFPVRTHLDGFYQCGASTFAPGIHGVTTSGLGAAAAALDCKPDELLTATGQDLKIYPAEDPSSWPREIQPRPRAA